MTNLPFRFCQLTDVQLAYHCAQPGALDDVREELDSLRESFPLILAAKGAKSRPAIIHGANIARLAEWVRRLESQEANHDN